MSILITYNILIRYEERFSHEPRPTDYPPAKGIAGAGRAGEQRIRVMEQLL
jgi:hypothetical protein